MFRVWAVEEQGPPNEGTMRQINTGVTLEGIVINLVATSYRVGGSSLREGLGFKVQGLGF